MDIMVGLIEMLAKMTIFAVFAAAGLFLGVFLRKKKNLKLEMASDKGSKPEEE